MRVRRRRRLCGRLGGWGGASGAKRAGGKRDHDEKGPERSELGDVAQGMGGSVHFGLLDHEGFSLCSCYVRVNGDGSHLPLDWLTRIDGAGPEREFLDQSFRPRSQNHWTPADEEVFTTFASR